MLTKIKLLIGTITIGAILLALIFFAQAKEGDSDVNKSVATSQALKQERLQKQQSKSVYRDTVSQVSSAEIKKANLIPQGNQHEKEFWGNKLNEYIQENSFHALADEDMNELSESVIGLLKLIDQAQQREAQGKPAYDNLQRLVFMTHVVDTEKVFKQNDLELDQFLKAKANNELGKMVR